MCGFAGMLDFNGLAGSPAERDVLVRRMSIRLAPRGPDDEQRYDDGTLALGFCRLSIVDVEGGSQPMWSEDRHVMSVVNGEIYNHRELRSQLQGTHRFRSQSDSEVVVHLYEDHGAELLDRLRGMFAIAVWDAPRRRLLLARDRLGIKPLYYARAGGIFLFGSELKALLAHPDCPRDPDRQALRRRRNVHPPVVPSFVRGVRHVPAGHLIVVEPGTVGEPTPYWSIGDFLAQPGQAPRHPPEHFLARYGELFIDAVREHLMSDVPVGIFLSGGIDSSLVAAAAAKEQAGLRCFTVDEPGTALSGELGQAHKVADSLSFPLDAVRFEEATLLDDLQFGVEYLEYMAWQTDSPRFVLEWFFKLELHRYVKDRYPELKVILTGTGADEFAGGYSTTFANRRADWEQYLEEHVRPRWARFRSHEDELTAGPAPDPRFESARAARSGYQHMMYMNAASLQYYNLWFEDRVSAGQGIEARVPFLDHRLVELLASVPPELHADLFWDKRIVRSQLKRLLPGYPEGFPKVPFIYLPGSATVARLNRGIVMRTFRDFCDKYASCLETGLRARRLEPLYRRITSGAPGAGKDAQSLLDFMQAVIFRAQCADSSLAPPALPSRSPLRAA